MWMKNTLTNVKRGEKKKQSCRIKSNINCRQLNWDTVSQPVNDLSEHEIQPNLLDN